MAHGVDKRMSECHDSKGALRVKLRALPPPLASEDDLVGSLGGRIPPSDRFAPGWRGGRGRHVIRSELGMIHPPHIIRRE